MFRTEVLFASWGKGRKEKKKVWGHIPQLCRVCFFSAISPQKVLEIQSSKGNAGN